MNLERYIKTHNSKKHMSLYVSGQIITQNDCVVYGNHNIVWGERSTVYGNKNRVTGSNSRVTGNDNYVNGNHVYVTGNDNEIRGDYSTIVGEYNRVQGQNCQINGQIVSTRVSRQNEQLWQLRFGNFIEVSPYDFIIYQIWSFMQSLVWSVVGCFFRSRDQNTPMPPNPFREFHIMHEGPRFIFGEDFEDEGNAPGGAATNIEGIKELKYTDEERPEEASCCIVCLSRKPDVVAMPCGHNNYCGYCVVKMRDEKIPVNYETNKIKCSLCMQDVDEFTKAD